jgi:Leucine-rich repeat (LRR) protein
MNHEPLMLDVAIDYNNKGDKQIRLDALKPLAPHIIWLNISNNDLQDAQLSMIALLTNLEKVRLEGNPISDKGIAQLKDFAFLNAINLNETKVSKEVLNELSNLPALKNVYLWKNGISKSDVEAFEKANSEVSVVL